MPRSLLLAALLLSAGPVFAGQEVDSARLGDLVIQDCGSCHGLTLKGGLGPALTKAALEPQSSEALSYIILYGIPETPMPGWQGLITEAEADWIAEALKDGRLE